ncbi:HAMP domain-containing protein [Acidovorax sp. HDW3]|uniref:methyl-accepting chemotaxis protein n=1 Tax=Acidovorax sp. HDW3 TaxID=2714923 RepID=UPI00140A0795|nr:methyl-accepting chemotaxis protein [Acidovorax sp. HDW3]QIL44607.1 HAMP domain-containing protein [Acidovorax sp. HDW3]
MFFNHLSVGRKLWALVLGLTLALLVLMGALLSHLLGLSDEAARTVQFSENRISMAVRWRGMVALDAHRAVIQMSTSDTPLAERMNKESSTSTQAITDVQNKVKELVVTDEGKAQLERIGAARSQALDIIKQAAALRSKGDTAAAASLIQDKLQPAVDAYIAELDKFVVLQEQRRDETKQQAQDKRQSALWLGLAIGAVVVLGALALSAWFVRSLTEPLQRAVSLADAIEGGDLTQDVHDERGDELGQLLRALSAMGAKLRTVVGEVRSGVESVSAAAGEIATGNHDLSARTEQTAANLEETAASMEELTATVTQSADTARQANQLAANAAQAAQRGGEVVGQVVSSMEHITESSRKISDIIGVIDGIAFQTNILALNAAVEAARAGEQGRGFAVVAGEVRSLAQRSAEAAKEIKGLITASVQNVEQGSQQVGQAGQSMGEIVESVRRVSDLIGEITASTTEQRDGIGQVNQAVANLDQMTQQNAALVEEASAAAASMSEQAQRLAQVVSVFNVGGYASSNAGRSAPRTSPAPRPAPRPVAAKPAGKPLPKPAAKAVPAPAAARIAASPKPAAPPASAEGDWESF